MSLSKRRTRAENSNRRQQPISERHSALRLCQTRKQGFFLRGGGSGGGELVLFPTQAHYLQISQQWKCSKLGDKMSTKKDAAACWEDTSSKWGNSLILPNAPRPVCLRKWAAWARNALGGSVKVEWIGFRHFFTPLKKKHWQNREENFILGESKGRKETNSWYTWLPKFKIYHKLVLEQVIKNTSPSL